jgi:hypothetical protein
MPIKQPIAKDRVAQQMLIKRVNQSKADFVKRLKDTNRLSIPDY